MMEPPSYEEASLHAPAHGTATYPPPPSYNASLHAPPSPPPTYGEAVTVQPDPFPVLTVPTGVTSQNSGFIIHPITQIGVTQPVSSRQTQPAVVTQPLPVPVSVSHLEEFPSLIVCPHCHHSVTTKVTHQPGKAAWCMCVLLTMMGFVCGCCLIPLMVRSLQDVHHSCPNCGTHLHTFAR
ncbi:lipopolysaccharide-induced tumor necrosis factor-alpha factor homolog [Epinephelus fuscoguttatus]|uniref:lipopolysaccharide-induced tumor necrosis factor-alpha factor homolog n=1 Tax=Epinephelus fuscoguttatus TaxID=293821 RepID=UPI0020D0AF95|nr:lipopolysaccharide-induced tumor necrosis factor-alpha factor homolog [Epinephelus fuscoguttatus]XP_049427440.1 lipopolysaccharide-induced tumor necrosis factor-alpha factor homolog [Epinephelus fuscoguttatus]